MGYRFGPFIGVSLHKLFFFWTLLEPYHVVGSASIQAARTPTSLLSQARPRGKACQRRPRGEGGARRHAACFQREARPGADASDPSRGHGLLLRERLGEEPARAERQGGRRRPQRLVHA